MNCRHWSDCGAIGGGCCALNLFGGRPSRGTCGACKQRDPIGPVAMIPPAPRPQVKTGGVGTEIAKLLKSAGIVEKEGCGCAAAAGAWNARGIEWCEQHADEIAAFLIEQGKKRGWLFGVAARLGAKPLVLKAIEAAKQNQKG